MGLVAGAVGGFLCVGLKCRVRSGSGLPACGGAAAGGGKTKKGLTGNGKAKRQPLGERKQKGGCWGIRKQKRQLLGGRESKRGRLLGNEKWRIGKDVKKSQYSIYLVKINRQNIDIM